MSVRCLECTLSSTGRGVNVGRSESGALDGTALLGSEEGSEVGSNDGS
jgi:hypothetical protein